MNILQGGKGQIVSSLIPVTSYFCKWVIVTKIVASIIVLDFKLV